MTDYDNSSCFWAYSKGICGYRVPDGVDECRGKCSLYEDKKDWNGIYLGEQKEKEGETMLRVINGMGKDAEIVTNAAGGKQSKAPMAMCLVDAEYLSAIFEDQAIAATNNQEFSKYKAITHIANFMKDEEKTSLLMAMDYLCDNPIQQVINIAKVLREGAEKYRPNNWRLIPEEEHINHALNHIMADLAGDTQDDHINHALCRLMMAYATEKSVDFEYNNYI